MQARRRVVQLSNLARLTDAIPPYLQAPASFKRSLGGSLRTLGRARCLFREPVPELELHLVRAADSATPTGKCETGQRRIVTLKLARDIAPTLSTAKAHIINRRLGGKSHWWYTFLHLSDLLSARTPQNCRRSLES